MGALLPCGSDSIASRLQVVGDVPTGAKMLSRAWSNIWVCVGVPAAGVEGDEGPAAGVDTLRCGGVCAVAAGAGGAAAAGCARGGVRGGGGFGGAVTVIVGTGVAPGAAGAGVLGGGCSAGVAGAGVCAAGACGAAGGAAGGGVVAGAVSEVCDLAAPARHSSISAELPSSINRF